MVNIYEKTIKYCHDNKDYLSIIDIEKENAKNNISVITLMDKKNI